VEANHKVEIDDTLALLGRIDRIDRDGDGLHIIDYKTGAPREPDPLQLQMYALIVAREFDPAPIRASYHYLGTGEWITQEVTEETMAQALEDVRQRVAVIVAEREYPASAGPLCGYCDFLEICRDGGGFVESHPVVLEEELSLEYGRHDSTGGGGSSGNKWAGATQRLAGRSRPAFERREE
jgi:CRISPR/Cas system-associated exonuclease Cas4 (RecB family)